MAVYYQDIYVKKTYKPSQNNLRDSLAVLPGNGYQYGVVSLGPREADPVSQHQGPEGTVAHHDNTLGLRVVYQLRADDLGVDLEPEVIFVAVFDS